MLQINYTGGSYLIHSILDNVGNTPLIKLECENINLYAKLEFMNPTGSVKDRAASYIIKRLLELGIINYETTLIESSSGNFGIALSEYCKKNGLKFYCVVDPHILPTNEMIISKMATKMIKVTKPDCNGGYLLTRIEKVRQLQSEIPNSYWVNQYGNPYNAEAYYNSLGNEICSSMDNIDYVFMGVSSGGTITGVSKKIKEHFPNAKIIAVDIVGSVIFGGPPKKRYIPGIGSSKVPEILKQARIDDVVMVDEVTTIDMCYELFNKHYIFAGGSSGSVFGAIRKYFKDIELDGKPDVLTIFPDKGERYTSTIYNQNWCNDYIYKKAAAEKLNCVTANK